MRLDFENFIMQNTHTYTHHKQKHVTITYRSRSHKKLNPGGQEDFNH